jgi:hypothetical protein
VSPRSPGSARSSRPSAPRSPGSRAHSTRRTLNAKLTAQLGLSAKESARLGRVAGKLYASNYGDSMEEVNAAIKSVVSDIDGMRKASNSRLKGITGDVLRSARRSTRTSAASPARSGSSCAPASRRTRRTR